MIKVRLAAASIDGYRRIVPISDEVVDSDDHYQFWLAFVHEASKRHPKLWYESAEPWTILLQKDLLRVSDTTLVDVNPRKELYKFTVTRKGKQLLQVVDPALIVNIAVGKQVWPLAAEWMAALSPEYLPIYLSHGVRIVRDMALARTRFLKLNGWPDKIV